MKLEGDFSRRKFLKMAVGSVAAGIVPEVAEANVEKSPRPKIRPEAGSGESENIEQVIDSFVCYQDRVGGRLDHFLEELPNMLNYGGKITKGDEEHRTRLEFLREALELPNFDPIAREKIRSLLPAKAFAESGLDAGLVSSAGAKGILQFMPATWKEHAASPEANILSLVEQVKATDSLLEQIRRSFENYCSDAMGIIKEVFFADNEEEFIEKFYVPVIINSFNAGAGTVIKVVQKFADRYSDSAKASKELYDNGLVLADEDVYAFMAHIGSSLNFHKYYGDQSSEYVFKIMAAREALDAIPEEYRVVLLGPEDVQFS